MRLSELPFAASQVSHSNATVEFSLKHEDCAKLCSFIEQNLHTPHVPGTPMDLAGFLTIPKFVGFLYFSVGPIMIMDCGNMARELSTRKVTIEYVFLTQGQDDELPPVPR